VLSLQRQVTTSNVLAAAALLVAIVAVWRRKKGKEF